MSDTPNIDRIDAINMEEKRNLRARLATAENQIAAQQVETERLRAALHATPTPEAILLQARKPDGGDWINIFPAQLQWMAKEGNDVRALDSVQQKADSKK